MKQIRSREAVERCIAASGYREHFSFDVRADTALFQAEAGEYIIREGIMPEYLFYLCQGRVKLCTTMENGQVRLIDFFQAPCFIGEMELISADGEVRAVQALEPCRCLALPLARHRERLLRDPRFLLELCRLLAEKNRRNVIAFTRNQSFPLGNRLASFILLTAEGDIYRQPHTQAAEYLGVSYRHLLYVLADFVKRGYLQKEGRSYRIADRSALERLSR